MVEQKSFFALYDYANEIEDGRVSVKEAEKRSKKDTDEFCANLRRKGIRYARSSSRQTREWWRLGVTCGLSCKAWLVSWME